MCTGDKYGLVKIEPTGSTSGRLTHLERHHPVELMQVSFQHFKTNFPIVAKRRVPGRSQIKIFWNRDRLGRAQFFKFGFPPIRYAIDHFQLKKGWTAKKNRRGRPGPLLDQIKLFVASRDSESGSIDDIEAENSSSMELASSSAIFPEGSAQPNDEIFVAREIKTEVGQFSADVFKDLL